MCAAWLAKKKYGKMVLSKLGFKHKFIAYALTLYLGKKEMELLLAFALFASACVSYQDCQDCEYCTYYW